VGQQAGFGVPVPDDVALLGFEFSSQAFANGTGQLTNALDVVLGP